MMKATCLVGLDVHTRQTHSAVLDPDSRELAVSRLRMAAEEVVWFLRPSTTASNPRYPYARRIPPGGCHPR